MRKSRRCAQAIVVLAMAGVVTAIPYAGVVHAADAASQLGLPWSQGQTWTLTGGPHTNNDVDSGPYNSLDLVGGDGI